MKKIVLFTATALVLSGTIQAQNTAPYWSLAGNSNPTTASKLGTTNGVSLRFYAGNVQRMMIGYASGNVAIGTTALTHRLTVAGNGRFTKGLQVDEGGIYVGATAGNGVKSTGTETGVLGIATGRYGSGVWGASDDFIGVYGTGGNYGLYGSGNFYGVYGTGSFGGIRGTAGSYGVFAESTDGGYGVYGTSTAGGTGVYGSGDIGLYGISDNTNSYAGYFEGDVYTTGSYLPSARNLKKNIGDLNSALALIAKLRPKNYEYKQEGSYKLMHLPDGKRYGLIAEDVEEVLPTLVKATGFVNRTAQAPDATGGRGAASAVETINFKAVNYTELIPILVKGIQEQADVIETLQQQMAELKSQMARLTGRGNTTSITGTLSLATPNPARGNARISYQIPAGSRAQLRLADAGGKTVKIIALNASTGFADVTTAGLSSGVYHYSLLVDGKIVETKKLTVAH